MRLSEEAAIAAYDTASWRCDVAYDELREIIQAAYDAQFGDEKMYKILEPGSRLPEETIVNWEVREVGLLGGRSAPRYLVEVGSDAAS